MREKQMPESRDSVHSSAEAFLLIHNDEIHSFDYVIDALVEVCGHSEVQAEQCTYIAHYKGSCDVKKGSRRMLEEMQLRLIEKGLKATIE